MRTHGHTTITNPTRGWPPARPMDRGRRLVLGVTGLAGLFMTAPGLAALLAPTWFAHTAGFPDIPTLATARPLQGADVPARRPPAGPKHPLLHGLLVPLTHGLGRPRTGTTLHPSPHPTT